MSGSVDQLVYMANQIAGFFASQPGDKAGAVAGHLRAFWAPSMRRMILAHIEAGGTGLDPMALAGVRRLGAEAG